MCVFLIFTYLNLNVKTSRLKYIKLSKSNHEVADAHIHVPIFFFYRAYFSFSILMNSEKPNLLEISRPYLTPNEISHLHSLTISEDKKIVYSQRKHQIFNYIFQIVKVLKFPLRVLNTTMIYYQKYYLFNEFNDSSEDFTNLERNLENDPYSIALTCLFLASKNEDCIKKLRDIQVVANKIRDVNLNEDQNYLDLQRKILLTIEYKLLTVLKFNFNNNSLILPSLDTLVIQFAKIKKLNYTESLFCWYIAFDLMSTPINLMLPPHCISLAIIIVVSNLDTSELMTMYNETVDGNQERPKIERNDFNCSELLVNESIIYILDYYVHQYNFSNLKEFLPATNKKSGKEQVFQFMTLKSKFNNIKLINEISCSRQLLESDIYLKLVDYSIGLKGSNRFMLGNKRRRFNKELDAVKK